MHAGGDERSPLEGLSGLSTECEFNDFSMFLCNPDSLFFNVTGYFSGPGRAIGLMCVAVYLDNNG